MLSILPLIQAQIFRSGKFVSNNTMLRAISVRDISHVVHRGEPVNVSFRCENLARPDFSAPGSAKARPRMISRLDYVVPAPSRSACRAVKGFRGARIAIKTGFTREESTKTQRGRQRRYVSNCVDLIYDAVGHGRTRTLGWKETSDGRTDAVGNSGAEWEPIILCAQVKRFHVDRDTYDTVCIRVYCACALRYTRAYINCISPLNGASWLTDCALLIRFPIIGGNPSYFHFLVPTLPLPPSFQKLSCNGCKILYLSIQKKIDWIRIFVL